MLLNTFPLARSRPSLPVSIKNKSIKNTISPVEKIKKKKLSLECILHFMNYLFKNKAMIDY